MRIARGQLRAAGEVDDKAHAAQRSHHQGGRPSNPLNDDDLAAEGAIQKQIARRRDTPPSLFDVAHTLHIHPEPAPATAPELQPIQEVRNPRHTPIQPPPHRRTPR